MLPNDSIYLKEMRSNAFLTTDPELKYQTLEHINSGTQGEIFRVKRKNDGEIFALKKCKP